MDPADLESLTARVSDLEREQERLRAQEQELEAVTARLRAIDAELDDAKNRAARRLPMLDNLRVASPCPASWDDMVGDARVRFCGSCEKNVYNVAALTRSEVAAILLENEGDACMRLYRRADGTVITADCPVGQKRKRRRRMLAGALVATAAGYAALTAFTPRSGEAKRTIYENQQERIEAFYEEEDVPAIMGSVAIPLDPPPER